ncbi:MAG: PD40 domain-containing protein [Thiomargarita sp.]|nr:PD40 domain-containing protein [Thiomargarita sp.]
MKIYYTLFKKRFNYYLLLPALITLFGNVYAHEIISRVSVDADVGGNGSSKSPTISADGRYIAFQSDADNLVPDDNNGFTDIFVTDRQTRKTRRVSINSNGTETNFVSFFPVISADGRFVAFRSDASNLVEDDSNRTADIFVHDQKTGVIQLVSVSSDGVQGNSTSSEPAMSADGRYVVFHSNATNLVKKDTNKSVDIFVHDRQTLETIRLSVNSKGIEAKGTSFGAAISGEGRYIAFSSNAANLVKDDKNKTMDVFVHDRESGETTLVSLDSHGIQGNAPSFQAALSADGHFVAFRSRATNLVQDDTNEAEDIFVHDRETGETARVSVDSAGQQANNGDSFGVSLSADGRYVLFNADADNLVADDDNNSTDVFRHDRKTGQTRRLTLLSQSNSYTASSYAPVMSYDGRWVAFESKAVNLVPNDFNETSDIFIYDQAYYASYEVSTGVLYIPVLTMMPDFALFRAKLVKNNKPLEFILERKSRFPIALEGIPSVYHQETRLLDLPRVEVFDPPKEIQRFEVEMRWDAKSDVFTIIQLKEE